MDDIIVEIPGIGEVAFPASMSRDQITQQVRRLSSQQSGMAYEEAPGISISYPTDEAPQAQPSMIGQLGRQAGLTARGAARGLTAIPAMGGDLLNQLINSIAGTNLPSASQSMENLMSRVGLPQPETPTERVAYDMTSAMSGVGAPAALAGRFTPNIQQILSPLTQKLGMQTTAAGTAAGAAGGIREEGGGEAAQMIGGLATGLATPMALGTLGAARGVGSALTRPFTQAGQEQMAGNLLRQQATDPLAAMRRMEQATPTIPGSQPTMAATAQDYGLASIERTLSQMPEASGEYAKRLAQNNLARNILVDKYTADKALSDAIVKRDQITGNIRNQAFEQKTPVKPTSAIEKIDNILRSPVGARDLVRNQLNEIKARIQAEIDDTGFADPARLYSVRQDIADIIEGNVVGSRAENTRKVASKQLIEIRQTLDNVIESGAPGYQEYLRMYRTMSQPVSQIKEMQNITTKASGGTVDPTTGVRTFTPVRFGKLVEQLADDTRNPLSKTQMGVLKKVANELDEGAMVNLPGVRPAGSDTFKNLTVANLLGSIQANPTGRGVAAELIQNFARPISWVYKGGEDAVRQLLVDAMLDPKIAAELMRKATPQNIQAVSRSLSQKAAQMGYGATFGINVAQ